MEGHSNKADHTSVDPKTRKRVHLSSWSIACMKTGSGMWVRVLIVGD